MPNAPTRLAALGLLCLAVSSVSPSAAPAVSALLIEGRLDGKALRIVADTERAIADVTFGDSRHAVDLDAGSALRISADGTTQARVLSAPAAVPMPAIEPWGAGPSIAGHPSVYHVMTLEGEVCGELLISPWMKPFAAPAVEALSILERIKGDGGIGPLDLQGACGALPFAAYALTGWPLMAGGLEQPMFRTETISFDYEPQGDELSWSLL